MGKEQEWKGWFGDPECSPHSRKLHLATCPSSSKCSSNLQSWFLFLFLFFASGLFPSHPISAFIHTQLELCPRRHFSARESGLELVINGPTSPTPSFTGISYRVLQRVPSRIEPQLPTMVTNWILAFPSSMLYLHFHSDSLGSSSK